MSSLIVRVVEFDLRPHPNADRMLVAVPRGMAWQCCVGKEGMEDAKLAVYIPIDSLLPADLATFLRLPDVHEGEPYKIRTLRLRGLVSQGLLISVDRLVEYLASTKRAFPTGPNGLHDLFPLGEDVAAVLGITKRVVERADPNMMDDPPGFTSWPDVESYNTYSHVIEDGVEVVLTEKIHGKCLRYGWFDYEGTQRLIVGTKEVCYKPDTVNEFTELLGNTGWGEMMSDYPGWILYGEFYGEGVQKHLHYGLKGGGRSFLVFAVWNGDEKRFLGYDERVAFLEGKGPRHVPVLYRGPWSTDLLSLADGPSFHNAHIREGMVITPVKEAFHEEVGRVALKVVSTRFLLKNYDE